MVDIVITPEKLSKLISDHGADATEMENRYNTYKGDVAITSREAVDGKEINNQVANDFRGEIIDQLIGYVFGNPISYQFKKDNYDDKQTEEIENTLRGFITRNNIELLDSETGKKSSICGCSSRLLYIDTDGKERVTAINPWQTIFIYDASGDNVTAAIRYYSVTDFDGEETEKAEVYDDRMVTYYLKDVGGYVLDPEKTAKLHLFSYVPLIDFSNNNERMSDFEKVESLIDAYDRAVSDAQNEIEEHRQAYMKFKGGVIDSEDYEKIKAKGGITVPEGGDVEYLIKQINDTFLENHKKTLKSNIYRFSKSVDMSDETFSGSGQTGESRKWKLLTLTQKAITKEREFTAGLRRMFKVVCSAWGAKNIPLDYEDLTFTYTRNLPVEIKNSAEVLEKLIEHLPRKLVYGLMPFIDDPAQVVTDWEEEQSGLPENDDIPPGSGFAGAKNES